jgi:hypothetical protein
MLVTVVEANVDEAVALRLAVVVRPVVFVVDALVVLAFTILLFSKLVFIIFAAVVPSRDKLVSPFMVVVEIIPFTVDVIRLVVDENESVFVVVAAIKLAKDVVEVTPLTLVVMMPVDVANDTELFDMTELVATTPFTVVVSVFPERV